MPIQTFMTVIAQDDHLTAGAWAACDQTNILMKTDKGGFSPAVIRSRVEQKNPVTECQVRCVCVLFSMAKSMLIMGS